MLIDFNNIDKLKRYKLMSNLIIPRPIAWISTYSNEGVLNLAPFSYFIPLSSNPPALIVSIGHKKDGSPKDTLKNILQQKKCSIAIPTTDDAQDVQNSASPLDSTISEFELFHIESNVINSNYPPVPKNAKVAFFCDFLQKVKLKESLTIPLILTINSLYIDDSFITDTKKLQISFNNALARVGAKYFALTQEIEVKK